MSAGIEYVVAGPAGLIIPIVLAAAAAGVQSYGQYKQAKADKKALDANARIERQNAYARERAARRSGMLQVRRQQLAAQAGGLLLEGSPLDQLVANTNEVEYQAISERNAGINASNYMRWQGRQGVKQARRNIWTSTITAGLMAGAGAAAQSGGPVKPTTQKFGNVTSGSSQSGAGLLAPPRR